MGKVHRDWRGTIYFSVSLPNCISYLSPCQYNWPTTAVFAALFGLKLNSDKSNEIISDITFKVYRQTSTLSSANKPCSEQFISNV